MPIKPGKLGKRKPIKENRRHNPRPREAQMSNSELRRLLRPLEEEADEREELKEAYKKLVTSVNMRAIELAEAGIPLKDIVTAAKFTRQNFYQVERAYKAGKLDNDPRKSRQTKPAKKSNSRKRSNKEKKVNKGRRTRFGKRSRPKIRTHSR